MKILNNQARAWIKKYTEENYNKIVVFSGKLLWNYQCHRNCVHTAIEESSDKIAVCIYFDGNFPIIHFLNIDKNNNFVDNTVGHWSSQYPYYFLKYIESKDFFNVDNIFGDIRKEIGNKMPWYLRMFSNYRG